MIWFHKVRQNTHYETTVSIFRLDYYLRLKAKYEYKTFTLSEMRYTIFGVQIKT